MHGFMSRPLTKQLGNTVFQGQLIIFLKFIFLILYLSQNMICLEIRITKQDCRKRQTLKEIKSDLHFLMLSGCHQK